MTYDEFRDKVRNAMHETIYTDSDGREILVIKVLEAYSLLTPKRPWVGLMDEEIDTEHDKRFPPTIIPSERAKVREFARAIEDKSKEKNA